MSSIEQQQKILEQLVVLIDQSCDEQYQSAACRFEYSTAKDGAYSVGKEFWYYLNGKEVLALLDADDTIKPVLLVPELHRLMKEHTGGDWKSFILKIDENRKVSAKFDYK